MMDLWSKSMTPSHSMHHLQL